MSGETKHSPEPWVVKCGHGTGRAQAIDDARGFCVVKWGGLGAKATVGTPNARRIVASVNACTGLPIEALESGAIAKALDILLDVQWDGCAEDYTTDHGAGWSPDGCPVCHGAGSHETDCGLSAVLRALGRLP